MNTYVILRRSGWRSPEELEQAVARSEQAGEDMADDQWLRSYVMQGTAGRLGTVGIYQASGPEAIRRHGGLALLPADELIPVVDTVVKSPDPQ